MSAAAAGARLPRPRVLPVLLAPVPPWKDLSPEAIVHVDDRFI